MTKLNPQHGPDTRILRQGVFSGGVQEAPAGVGGVRRGRGGGPLRSVNTQGTCSNPREPPGTYRMLLGGAQPRRRKPGPLSFTHSKYSVKNWFFCASSHARKEKPKTPALQNWQIDPEWPLGDPQGLHLCVIQPCKYLVLVLWFCFFRLEQCPGREGGSVPGPELKALCGLHTDCKEDTAVSHPVDGEIEAQGGEACS